LQPHLDVPARLAVVEARLRDIDTEVERVRDRLHTLEATAEAERLLMDEVRQFPGRMNQIAEQAATAAIDLALENRDHLHLTAEERKRAGVKFKVELLSVGTAIGGFLFGLLTVLLSHHG
jgi:hypothetical protein